MKRLFSVMKEEFGDLDPNPLPSFAMGSVNCIPQWRFGRLRVLMYRLAGFRIGHRTLVMGRIDVRGPGRLWRSRLQIGEDCLITTGFRVVLDGNCTIGRGVTISPGVTIHTGSHQIGPTNRRCDPRPIGKDVEIGDGSWICMNVLILPGVRIGNGSVVAAGSVVVKDVGDNMLVAGNPAVEKRSLAPALPDRP